MNQNLKSVLFIGVAALVAATAWLLTRTESKAVAEDDQRGKPLVADFDPNTAASMEIIQFDEDTSTPRDFKVEQAQQQGQGPLVDPLA